MRRLFIGINFTDEEKDYFATTQKILEKYCTRARYTRMENFHLTLSFLGDMSTKQEQQLIDIINEIEIKPLILKAEHIGFFAKKRGYIAYLGFKPQPELTKVAVDLNDKLKAAKLVISDEFIYTPHITLCRNAQFILPLVDISKGIRIERDIQITNVTLYESINLEGELTYRPLYIRKVI